MTRADRVWIEEYLRKYGGRLGGWRGRRGEVRIQLWVRVYRGREAGKAMYYQTLPETSVTFTAPNMEAALGVVKRMQGMLDEALAPVRAARVEGEEEGLQLSGEGVESNQEPMAPIEQG